MPALLVKEGPLTGRELVVEGDLVFGRVNADVTIEDLRISRRHARVRAVDDSLEIEDLESLNGTWVNQRRIEGPTRLAPGDVVRIGETVIEVVAYEPAPAAPEVTEPPAPIRFRAQAPLPASPPAPVPPAGPRAVCPGCGADVPADARFCPYCGRDLAAAEAPPARPAAPEPPPGLSPQQPEQDELRLVTALFTDIVGSTSLGERLSPDEVKSLIGECVSRMVKAVEQFGGTVESYMGDGIAAFFGMPVAHEDDPERAAYAALRILEVVSEYSRDIAGAWGLTDFNVRVGINSGQTAVGHVGGAERHMVALGDATNVAARLQSSAQPGTIAVGESTARRLEDRFVLESLGEVSVKGRERPVSSWRLVGPRTATDGPASTPLVGREAEVETLRAGAEDLVKGRGHVLFLVGDTGIGKTRLLGELHAVADPGIAWLEGHCHSYGGELLYGPFVEILRTWLDVEDGEADVSVRTKLRAKMGALRLLDAADALPPLGRLLGVQMDQGDDRLPSDPGELAAEIRRAYRAWAEALCAEQPVIFAIDDMHWADPATRELAGELLAVTDRGPLLLAVAFRADIPSEGRRFRLHALEHYAHRVTELPLEPLSREAAEQLVSMLIPDGLDPVSQAEVVARAEGNPLYLEELLRSLVEGGGLERRQHTWALTSASGALLPPAIEGLLVARFDRLPEGPRRVAQVAAVIGRTFPERVLRLVAPPGDVEQDLAALLRAQVIRELRRYPELEYTFKHGLLRDAAISTLTPSRREDLYGRVAAVFEDTYAASRDEYLEILAYYYARSRDLPKALEYLEEAGERAASLHANAQAVELWKRAAKIALKLGDPDTERRITARLDRLT